MIDDDNGDREIISTLEVPVSALKKEPHTLRDLLVADYGSIGAFL